MMSIKTMSKAQKIEKDSKVMNRFKREMLNWFLHRSRCDSSKQTKSRARSFQGVSTACGCWMRWCSTSDIHCRAVLLYAHKCMQIFSTTRCSRNEKMSKRKIHLRVAIVDSTSWRSMIDCTAVVCASRYGLLIAWNLISWINNYDLEASLFISRSDVK